MTEMMTEGVEMLDLSEFEDIEIPCDIGQIWPELNVDHEAARWIGLKECGHHRLLCEACKGMYLILAAKTAFNRCTNCDAEGKFVSFELMRGRS